ncbi:MAG: L,D-transpeptidase [Verrucomicrobiales bacterium]
MNQSLFSTTIAVATILFGFTACKTTEPTRAKLAPGQYEWHPDRSPGGPVLVVVSIDDQVAYVYRNGIEIARSTVSTGREGKETPTGVFTILQRNVEHESSIYEGAQMPYMQRLTWGGIAMHAGDLPGYPASAGCVRLPLEFSEKIYGVMGMGGTVVITKRGATPSRSSRPAGVLLASRASRSEDRAVPEPTGDVVWEPSKSPSGPFSILVSYADKRVYVWRNGIQIGQCPISIAGSSPPEGVFLMLDGTDPPNPQYPGITMHPWTALTLSGGETRGDAVATLRSMIKLPGDFHKKINKIVAPGTILLATSQSSNSATRSGRDFTIMKPEG